MRSRLEERVQIEHFHHFIEAISKGGVLVKSEKGVVDSRRVFSISDKPKQQKRPLFYTAAGLRVLSLAPPNRRE